MLFVSREAHHGGRDALFVLGKARHGGRDALFLEAKCNTRAVKARCPRVRNESLTNKSLRVGKS